jgi:hypothetical protein
MCAIRGFFHRTRLQIGPDAYHSLQAQRPVVGPAAPRAARFARRFRQRNSAAETAISAKPARLI